MMHDDRIGLDLGLAAVAADLAAPAAVTGARLARVRFALAGRPLLDGPFLAGARASVAALRGAGLTVLAVVDSDLTVAPGGAGAFGDHPPGMLAEAWIEEMVGNAGALAAAVGEGVAIWEVLPRPNAGDEPRIAAARWADLLGKVARAIRSSAPAAVIVSGGLLSDEMDDAVDYLRAAWRAGAQAGTWPNGVAPCDAVGLQLDILPDGGASEEAVGAAVRERVQRLWRALEQVAGTDQARAHGLFVTAVGWDANRAGEMVQARNLWTVLDTLTTEEVVRGVVWHGLVDEAALATGLIRGGGAADADDRRPAWQAFSDFTRYFRQIRLGSADTWLGEAAGEARLPEPEVYPPPLAPDLVDDTAALTALVAADAGLPEPEVFPPPLPPNLSAEPPTVAAEEVVPERPVLAAAAALATAVAGIAAAAPEAAEVPATAEEVVPERPVSTAAAALAAAVAGAEALAPEEAEATDQDAPAVAAEPPAVAVAPEAAPAPWAPPGVAADAGVVAEPPALPEESVEPGEVVFRMPSVAEVLTQQGLEGPLLAAVVAALQTRHGDLGRLPPGEYRVQLAGESPAAPGGPTNQQVISALYRAGGGTWALFERSGLVLGDLAAHRNDPYAGPPLAMLGDLSVDERRAVAGELERLVS